MTIMVEMRNDVESVTDPTFALFVASIAPWGIHYYRVAQEGGPVSNAGVRLGDMIAVDQTQKAIARVCCLDVILVQVDSETILRQYVKPGLFITNRPEINEGIAHDDSAASPTVRGVVVRTHTRQARRGKLVQ
jgi:hypothetical protein